MGARFLHCADLHLGARPLGLDARFGDLGEAFGRVIDAAVGENVDFMLISGDFFHHRAINAPTLDMALEGLGRLRTHGIPVYAIEGNHDAALYVDGTSWMGFLNDKGYLRLLNADAGAERFMSEYDGTSGCVAFEKGVRIIGVDFYFSSSLRRLQQLADEMPEYAGSTVLLLHTGVNRLLWQAENAVSAAALECFAGKVDYFALGHVHSRYEVDGGFYNPGAPEWVHVDEMKREGAEKGCYLVDIEAGRVEAGFLPSSPRPLLFVSLPFRPADGQAALEDAAVAAVAEAMDSGGPAPVVEITLLDGGASGLCMADTQAVARAVEVRCGVLKAEVWVGAGEARTVQEKGAEEGEPVERRVLRELVGAELPGADTEEACAFVLGIRDALEAGAGPDVIAQSLEEMADRLLRERENVG